MSNSRGQVPVRPSNASMATEPYVRRKPYAKKAYSKKTSKSTRYSKYPVTKSYVARPRAPPKVAMKVSDCSMRYMATLCNPFEAEPGACVPCDLFPLPSQKFRAFTRGTFSLGTTGYGFIQANASAFKDVGACVFTSVTSVMGPTTALNAVSNTNQAQMGTLPYAAAESSSIQTRVVAVGLRVRYAGAEGTRSGTIACYEEQDHATVGNETFLTVQQAPSAVISRPSGDGTWDGTVCSSGPCTPGELEFVTGSYPSTPSGSVTGGYMAIVIQGAPGDQYNFEMFEHLEYIGQNVAAKTPSHADTDQYGKIIQSAKEISAVQPITPGSGPGLFERFAKKVGESLPQIINLGVGALRAYEGDPGGYAQLLGGAGSMIFGDGGSTRRIRGAPVSDQRYPLRLTDRQRAIMA